MGERVAQVKAWIVANHDRYQDGAVMRTDVVEHFNDIQNFWKGFALECIDDMIQALVRDFYTAARRGEHSIAFRSSGGVAGKTAAQSLIDEIRSKLRRASVADIIAEMKSEPRKWHQHYENVGGSERIPIFEMTKEECLRAVAIRRRQAAPHLALALLLEFAASKLMAPEQKIKERFTEEQFNDLWLTMVGGDEITEGKEAA